MKKVVLSVVVGIYLILTLFVTACLLSYNEYNVPEFIGLNYSEQTKSYILSIADIVAAAIQGTVNYFTGYGQYVPIDEERLLHPEHHYNAIPTPNVPKLSYAGRHCKE